jgi:hypothetical protein
MSVDISAQEVLDVLLDHLFLVLIGTVFEGFLEVMDTFIEVWSKLSVSDLEVITLK